MIMMRTLLLVVAAGLLWPTASAMAADLDGWRLVQLSAKEQAAVFAAPDGQLRLSKVGDRLGEKLTVTGFDGDRVVLEKPGEWGRVTLFVSLAEGRQQIASRERQPLRKPEFSWGPGTLTSPLESPAPATAQ
jgi:hypothetical protein